MTVGELAALLATLDQSLPVTMGRPPGTVGIELRAIVRDDWWVPAEPGGLLYLGPHAVLTAVHAVTR